MRLLTFMDEGRPQLGALYGDRLVARMDALLQCCAGYSMAGILAAGPALLRRAADALTMDRIDTELLPLEALILLAPVPSPTKIIGAARNYHDALAELKLETPARPQLFAKLPNTVLAPGAPIPLWPASAAVTYEGELAVVVGKRGRDISHAQAMNYVGGYTVLNDVSATDVTKRDGFLLCKNLDGSCPFGPVLVTPDEIPDPHNLRLTTSIDGRVVQDSNTSRMVFDIPKLIAAISEVMILEPGDVIATGTPAGVAVAHTPPLFLREGMTISVTIEQVGTLTNPVGGAAYE